jgi:hypothetical protein
MSDKPKAPYRDPKYSGWPGPEPVEPLQTEAVQVDIEEAVAAAPPKKRAKLKAVDAE